MKGQKGFGLVEMAVLLVVIGLAGLIAVPQFLSMQEREKASEAFKTLKAVQSAQEEYRAATGVYASNLRALKIQETAAQYFDFGLLEAGQSGSMEDSWSLTMTRKTGKQFNGEYTVTFNNQGFDPNESTISDLPGITPLQAK